jgi:uncharacterized protein (TIGR02246 family)
MKTRPRLILALGLGAVLAAGGLVTVSRPSAGAQEQKAGAKEQPAKGRREAFIAAFNKGNAKAVAAFWTPDATYVDQVGHEHKGRAAIEQLYEKVFAARKGAKLAIHVTAAKQLSPDVTLEDGFTEVTSAEGGPPTVARFTAVLVKQGSDWYLQRVQDAVAHPPSHAEHLENLEWLIGEWTGESTKGESAAATYDWAENQNFIVSSFATTLNGVPLVGGTQWIGWDAAEKQVRSWSFYSHGGFGEATWTGGGGKWAMKTIARMGDGKKVTATNILTRTDDDHMTWQMTGLTVDGKSLPDPQPVKLKRVNPAQP